MGMLKYLWIDTNTHELAQCKIYESVAIFTPI